MIPNICSTSSGDRPIDGSSNSITRGRAMTARPMASICCSPPDKVAAIWCWRSFRRGNIA
ncbi:Protein of uncharacterised function (DUF1602) [Mycobacterium tuberculosis]|nr:Protein of uncharacterised function (DUF1602) [Mycobacterium tuberculosis]